MSINGGFFKGPNATFEIGLNPYQIAIYLYLVRCSNNGESAFPSVKTISEKCGIGITKVKSVLSELETAGLVTKNQRSKNGKKLSNTYTVNYPRWSPYDYLDGHDTANGWSPDDHNKELYINNQSIKKKHYINFFEIDGEHPFIKIYNDLFQDILRDYHPRITEDQLEFIVEQLNHLERYGITEESFEEVAADHLSNLPESNNGNILAFLQASARYFEVNRSDIWS